MTLRHFLTTLDYSKEELLDLLKLIKLLKVTDLGGYTPKLLPDASQAKTFEKSFADSQIDIAACVLDESTVLNNWTDDTSDPQRSLL